MRKGLFMVPFSRIIVHNHIYHVGEYIGEGPEWNLSATMAKLSENVVKHKKYKNIHFFQFFLTFKATTSNKHIST